MLLGLSTKIAPKLGVRHLQVLFLFTCGILSFYQRMNLSVGIVALTNAQTTNSDFPEYKWTEKQKSYVLSASLTGALFTQLLGGYFSARYGAKTLLFSISLATALLSIGIPYSVSLGGWQLLCGLRLVQGMCMGAMFPTFYTHLAKWCPKEERNRLGGIMQTSLDIGTALGFASSGLLAASPMGWPSVFYIPGFCGLIWCILWQIYGANLPAECSFITLAERKRIELAQERDRQAESGTAPPVPWREIFTSRPFLVLAFCKMTQACSFYTLMLQIPSYIHGIFQYNIRVNALVSALPFVMMCISSFVILILADYLGTKHNVRQVIIRKSINTWASWVPAVAFVILAYLSEKSIVGRICCLIAAVSGMSGQAIGSSLNHIDLSPNFAGLLFGISNTLMSLAGVLSPLIVGITVSNPNDLRQWRTIFLGIAVLLFIGNLLYLIFGRMNVQPWNATNTTQLVAPVIQTPSEVTTNITDAEPEIKCKATHERFTYLQI